MTTQVKHKLKASDIEEIGTCHRCGEPNLATNYGDAMIEGKPVCWACQHKPPATERSEGARASDSAPAADPHAK